MSDMHFSSHTYTHKTHFLCSLNIENGANDIWVAYMHTDFCRTCEHRTCELTMTHTSFAPDYKNMVTGIG